MLPTVKPTHLVKGAPGHPVHPPLTGATIGAYTVATVLAVLGALGVSEADMARAWWLALIVALALTVPTAITGLIDWAGIRWGSKPWNTATAHLMAMVTAPVVFTLAAVVGHAGYVTGEVSTAALVLTLVGYALLTIGGWLGGSLVFVHGVGVLAARELGKGDAVPTGGGSAPRGQERYDRGGR